MQSPSMPEAEFRKRVQSTFDGIVAAFDDVDPDVAECEAAFGSVTISFVDRSRCILSVQPSVRQIWLALASLGTAHHFSLQRVGDPARDAWVDDKDPTIELLSRLEQVLQQKAGLTLKLAKP